MKRFLISVSAAGACLAWGCTRPCAFDSQCNGDILETCTPGSGLIGPSLQTEDCSQEFAACLELDAGEAACAADPCDGTEFLASDGGIFPFETNCIGTVLYSCEFIAPDAGFVQGVDCSTIPADAYGDPSECIDQGGGNASCGP
jgi:hypothetical protein